MDAARRRSARSQGVPTAPLESKLALMQPVTPLKRAAGCSQDSEASSSLDQRATEELGLARPRSRIKLEETGTSGCAAGEASEPVTPSPVGRATPVQTSEDQPQASGSHSSLAGSSSADAASARARASDKASTALSLMARAAACCTGPSSSLPASVRRNSVRIARPLRSATCCLTGVRVSVYWPDDKIYYPGVITSSELPRQHHVRYDDDHEEWMTLANERFAWRGPRAKSAGCTSDVRDLLLEMRAENIVPCPSAPAATLLQATAEAACGWQVAVFFLGTASYMPGQLIAYNPRSGRHHIVYADGYDEWLVLAEEAVQWLQHSCTSCLCLPRGHTEPSGTGALGWQVAVYDAEDQMFMTGLLTAFSAETGHQLSCGSEQLHFQDLAACKIKWLTAPQQPAPAMKKRSTASQRPQPIAAPPLDMFPEDVAAAASAAASPGRSSASSSLAPVDRAWHHAPPVPEELLTLPTGPGLTSLAELLHNAACQAPGDPPDVDLLLASAHAQGPDLLDKAFQLHALTTGDEPWHSPSIGIPGSALPAQVGQVLGGGSPHDSLGSLASATESHALSGSADVLDPCPELAFLDFMS